MFGFLAQLLAWCYDVVPNYGIAITMFTLIVMLAVTPLTVKGMRSMAEMARLQPEMKKLQDQYKNDRVKLNEEMQVLFKEHKVNPLGGCLPTLLPLPIFFIIFRLLRGLDAKSSHHIFDPRRIVNGLPSPKYLAHSSSMYQHLVADGGKMVSFGMDLGKSARDSHGSIGAAIPFYALIVIMTVSQYVQQRQMNARNPQAANANPQMKMTMQLFPAFYALISLTIPASVVFYLLISGLFRMAQNSISYRFDPRLSPPPGGNNGDKAEKPGPRPIKPDKGLIEAKARPKAVGSNGSTPANGTGAVSKRQGQKPAAGTTRVAAKPVTGGAAAKPVTGGDAAKPAPAKKRTNGNATPADAPDAKPVTGAKPRTGGTRSVVNAKPPGARQPGRVTPRGSDKSRPRKEN
jgi:YidC/Oxa1 family membrane protein insertase